MWGNGRLRYNTPNNIHARLKGATAEVRQTVLGKPFPKGNAASAEVHLDNGVSFSTAATSRKYGLLPKPIPKSKGGLFEPAYDLKAKRLMDTDSEYKIYAAIGETLQKLPKNQQIGTVYLYTERAQCGSCEWVQKQFEKMFPNVNVKVNHTYSWE